MTIPDDGLTKTLDLWCETLRTKDAAAAAALRDDGYRFVFGDGRTMSRAEELEQLAAPEYRVTSTRVAEVRREGEDASAIVVCSLEVGPHQSAGEVTITVRFRKRDGRWLAVEARMGERDAPPAAKPAQSATWRTWARRQLTRLRLPPPVQERTYFPYKAREDFALPKTTGDVPAELPIPPQHLWLGYNYPAFGKAHVDTMLSIANGSGFSLQPGDRVLDLGCGAGRMIRHLRSFADSCEIWGTDISAEHILWCKRNLSPPFRFATTTTIPHLPFEDRSFNLIYCGSVFTHIDDLADAWLLELHRILAPGGRLYVTIHDEHTVALIESGAAKWLDLVTGSPVYAQAKNDFDMISIGRGSDSQVFYHRDYFCRMARTAFDVVSITPEAYFYQTAVLLKRR